MKGARFRWLALLVTLAAAGAAAAEREAVPRGRALKELVERYLDADPTERRALREEADRRYAPLLASVIERTQDEMLQVARRHGPRLGSGGTNYWFDEKQKRGKYIVAGKPAKTLFLGLHGGGAGVGDAGSMAAGMGGGGWFWIFPEVLEKTEHGWTDAGTEEFVLELVEAAKRTGRVDPNRIYVSGHSMGGYGTWTYLGHHPDVFAGGAAYAGAPTCYYAAQGGGFDAVVEGILPNLLNSRFLVFQSTDDLNVPPAANVFAAAALGEWKQRRPDGFDFRYVQVDDRGHAAPKEGYLPSQRWVAEHVRVARPPRLLWQPVLDWKRQFHWLYWETPERNALLQVDAMGSNRIEVTTHAGSGAVGGLSLLLGAPLVDLAQEVVVTVNGEERFRGQVEPTLSTLLMTIPRADPELLFHARVALADR